MTATPVGDWIRQRYPDNPGATHWMGEGDDPGCCGGPHPACTYAVAAREGTAAERERVLGLLGDPVRTHFVICGCVSADCNVRNWLLKEHELISTPSL